MDCIHLNREPKTPSTCWCHAQPLRKQEIVAWYKPTEEEIKQYCIAEFIKCPRYKAIIANLHGYQ